MKKIRLAPDFALPADAVTSTLVIYGGKGMGKTNLGSVLCEELAGERQRFAALDPMGVMWGLRYSEDGKGRGIEVLLLGGRRGDIPIEPSAGAVVADLVVDESVNVVIDISRRADGKMWTKGEKIRFVADYMTRLYERQGETMRPLMQIVDEAARFVPQTIPHGSPELARCVGAIEQLVEEGRNVGVGVCLITQRSARMNKSVSELADCMIAFRTIGPNSVAAILDWFGEHVAKERWKGLVEQLRGLPRGTALVVSPGWLRFEGTVDFRARRTFDSSPTPTGKERKTSGDGARVDLTAYADRMKATIEKAKADDPRELRKRIAEMEKQLARVPAPVPAVPPQPIPVFTKDDRELVEKYVERIDKLSVAVAGWSEEIRIGTSSLATVLGRLTSAPPRLESRRDGLYRNGQREAARVATLPKTPLAARPAATGERLRDGESALKAGAREMLRALARLSRPLSRTQVATLAGLSPTSGTFASYMSVLRVNGLITEDARAGTMSLTALGGAAAGDVPPTPATTAELVQLWAGRLKAGARQMLDVLVESYPREISRVELAERAGLSASSGTFASYLSALTTNGLAERTRDGVQASASLFLG